MLLMFVGLFGLVELGWVELVGLRVKWEDRLIHSLGRKSGR